MSALHVIHTAAALIVLAEAINKLHRTNPCAHGLTLHARVVTILKACAWWLLGFGAGVSLLALLLDGMGIELATVAALHFRSPDLSGSAVMAGFAVLIFRTRVKEG